MHSLSNSVIGYAPLVNRQRQAIAARTHIQPMAVGAASHGKLYQELVAASPADAPTLLMAVQGQALTEDILSIEPVDWIWIEVPATFVSVPAGEQLVVEMRRRGFTMVLNGRPEGELSAALLASFKLALIHVDTDRRLKEPVVPNAAHPMAAKRNMPYAQLGVQSIAMMERCFATGATAVVGWPFEDSAKHTTSVTTNPDFATLTRLLQMVDKGEDVSAMEGVIRRDPALAYRLLRYINSPAFGLRIEIQSFRHAVMMLGYAKLRRWLMLLLATSSKQPNLRPIMFASFRRGLFLEHLVGQDQDESMRDELFILGVFSFLDKLFKEPFDRLLTQLNVPERVYEALTSRTGPYAAYVAIAQAIEQGPSASLPDQLTDAVMSMEQCNRAVMRALLTPDLLTE